MEREKVMLTLSQHYDAMKTLYGEDRIVGVFLQGSQNYGMDDEFSDIDTKCLVVPSLKELVMAEQPTSITHYIIDGKLVFTEEEKVVAEHCDAKDVRLYWKTLLKANINFVEILFTDYFIVNPLYEDLWAAIVRIKEGVARVNPLNAIKAMMGMVSEKEHALTHRYPSRAAWIDEYGYDPKQLSHLIRIAYFAYGYMNGHFTYADLVKGEGMLPSHKEKLVEIKRYGCGDLSVANKIADTHVAMTKAIYEAAKKKYDGIDNEEIKTEMFDIMRQMVERGLRRELR